MAVFAAYSGSNLTSLTDALLAPSSGIVINSGSIVLDASGQNAVNFYDGSLAPLGIGSGLLITSGTTPGLVNTVGWFGTDNSIWPATFYNGDPDIDAVVNTVFQTQSYDATTLQFDFTVTDPGATSVSFDLVFGTDEYPEWVDQFVDCGIVMVNGVNYALFNHDPLHPLSVVSSNLAAGYFQDNAANAFPIEYDGVSHVLKIVAPIISGGATNHIKIGIADTGDHIYDSGLFLANFSAGNIPGSGVVIDPNTGTDNSDSLTGSSKDEYFDLKGGDDTCYAGAGDDIVVAGSGNDMAYGGSGADQLKGDAGDDSLDGGADLDTAVYSKASGTYVITAAGAGFAVTDTDGGSTSEGTDTLTDVEYVKFSDGLFALGPGGVLTPVTDPGTPPANTPGAVVISGIASVGKTLTATVSDPNGISGPVGYQWQVSGDNGATWTPVGADSDTYVVTSADVGKDIQVVASYTDNGANAEAPISAAKTIISTEGGDLVVTLLQMTAPLGASTMNPLTTLVQDAIDLGVSPNVAALAIKAGLGLPGTIDLASYDAYAALQVNPADPVALAVEQVAVQVAILTSLSDDDTGVSLTLKVLEAAANGQALDLADANDLAHILGIDITGIVDWNAYPEPLREIYDRNKSMADALADGGGVGAIETEWQDLLSINDGIASKSIADLSIHINQAPTGNAVAVLANGVENAPYIVSASDLLQGFSDSDGGTLSVSGLSADNGSVVDNLDGTFTITPTVNFAGPVELTYWVVDGQGGSAPASQLLVIEPVNDAPGITLTNIVSLTAENGGEVKVADIAVVDDALGTNVLSLSGADASAFAIVGTELYFTGGADFETKAAYDVTVEVDDATVGGSPDGSQSLVLGIADVNEAPGVTLTNIVSQTAENGGAVKVADIAVVDDALGSNVLSLSGADASAFAIVGTELHFTGGADFETKAAYDVTVEVDDTAVGGSPDGSQSLVLGIADVNEAPPGVTVTGTGSADVINGTAGDDTLSGLGGNDTINAFAGNDFINGGAGADKMRGGTGNDLYVVDNKSDLVTENFNEGIDTVSSSITYKLGTNIENLSLTGASNVNATGNALDNQLSGNIGNNVLVGSGGSDTLTGGGGADRFVFTAVTNSTLGASDVVTDFVSGTDLIDVSAIDANNLTIKKSEAFLFGGEDPNVLNHGVTWFERDGDTFVQADVNGDSTADFQIVLAGTGLSLHATDFLL